MKTDKILFHLSRSNPGIIRLVTVPVEFPLKDLPELCRLLFGLNPEECACEMRQDTSSAGDSASGRENLSSGRRGMICFAKSG